MKTKIVSALADGSVEEAATSLERTVRAAFGNEPPRLLVAFASTSQPLGALSARLRRAFPETPLVGASTAGEFTEAGDRKGAVSLLALGGDYRVFAGIGTGLKQDPERALASAVQGLPRSLNGYEHRTGLLLLDPLAGNGEETTLLAAALLGSDEPLAGGAAGDDLNMQATEVACGARAASNAVVVAQIFSKKPLGLGVSHGHLPLSRPLRVTKASGSLVMEVEGRPAWDVWREETRTQARGVGIDSDSLPPDSEGAFLLRYEAGLKVGEGDSYKIRAPLARGASGAIQFACGIPEGSVIQITESVAERQIGSAREAARRARARIGGAEVAGALVFDCICRNLILGDRFCQAVQGISDELGGAPLAGFETYGEIALDAGDMSGFHNTTSVVLAFPS